MAGVQYGFMSLGSFVFLKKITRKKNKSPSDKHVKTVKGLGLHGFKGRTEEVAGARKGGVADRHAWKKEETTESETGRR